MADVEAAVRELVNRDRDCTAQALSQMGLRRKVTLLLAEWKAAGGGDVLPDIRDKVRLRAVRQIGNPVRMVGRR
ncbi:hypothetical protein [Bradyrhizobium sp.]|uniref:hypothetical protein n=1 Tax=Bradyrhizobium sp. TaxID=376 RepID=UPI0039E50306